MKNLSRSYPFATRTSLWGCSLCAVVVLFLVTVTRAAPVTYTGFTITDGQLGTWAFHNARVYLSFKSDTNNVQFMQFPDPLGGPGATIDAWVNLTGKASVTIISGRKVEHATFTPGQIFVSVDLGNTGRPHVGARGVGFSSFTSNGNVEPTYPLGLEDGTLDWGDILPPGIPSPALTTLSVDLKHTTAFSGRAWPCVGFSNDCTAPNALHTVGKGDLYLGIPYSLGTPPNEGNGRDSLSAGFFVVDVGETEDDLSVPVSTTWNSPPTAITYYGYVISDVTLGYHHYPGAQVYLSFAADTSTLLAINTVGFHGFVNFFGNAHVTIIRGEHVVSADIAPEQIFVYYDVSHASIGFGSFNGGLGYPLSLTANSDYNFLVENSSVGAVSDLMSVPAHASLYSPATAGLATDLTNPTTLSAAASSCVAFDPLTSACSNLTPIALSTNRGNLYLFEPYTDDETANSVPGPYSINWGVFWAEPGHPVTHD